MDLKNGLDLFVLVSVIAFDVTLILLGVAAIAEVLKEKKEKNKTQMEEIAKKMIEAATKWKY